MNAMAMRKKRTSWYFFCAVIWATRLRNPGLAQRAQRVAMGNGQ